MQMPPLPISTPNMVLFLEGTRKDGGDDAQSAVRWEAEDFAGLRGGSVSGTQLSCCFPLKAKRSEPCRPAGGCFPLPVGPEQVMEPPLTFGCPIFTIRSQITSQSLGSLPGLGLHGCPGE